MGTIILDLPKDLKKEAEAAGLLTSEAFAAILRENLRRHHLRELQQDAKEMAADDIPSMTMEEIQAEMNAVRAEGREKARTEAGWLPEALRELDGIDQDTEQDGLPPVSEHARSEARRLLLALSNQSVAPTVYPTEDAEVALYFKPPGVPAAVQIWLESDGGATWSSKVPGHDVNGRCEQSAQLPLDLLMASLRALSKLFHSD